VTAHEKKPEIGRVSGGSKIRRPSGGSEIRRGGEVKLIRSFPWPPAQRGYA